MDNRNTIRSDGPIVSINPLVPSDESSVRTLFTQQSMNFAGFSLCYDRGLHFKSLLHLQAPNYQTYLAKQNGELRSVISVASGPRWLHVNGQVKKENVAVVSDFRIDGSRFSRKNWRQWLGEVFELYQSEFSEHAPKYFLAFVLKGNQIALRNFLSGHRDKPFELKEVGSVRMINILAAYKSFSLPNGYRVSRCHSAADKTDLLQFIKNSEQKKQAGYVVDSDSYCEIQRRHQEWGFEWNQFILVRNPEGNVASCALPWCADSSIKNMYFTKAPRFLSILLKGLRRIGLSVPMAGEPIKTLYLTHLNISARESKDQMLACILHYVYKNELHRGYQMISFPDWWNLPKSAVVFKNTIHQMTEVGIYSIAIEKSIELEPDGSNLVGFEMAVI